MWGAAEAAVRRGGDCAASQRKFDGVELGKVRALT
jgi:hypothetical protein